MSFIEDFKKLFAWIGGSPAPSPSAPPDDSAATRSRQASEKRSDARQRVTSYPRTHWQPLLDLIPEIEAMAARGEKFGQMKGGEQRHWWSAIQFPWMEPSPIVNRFSALVVELGGFVPLDGGDGDANGAAKEVAGRRISSRPASVSQR